MDLTWATHDPHNSALSTDGSDPAKWQRYLELSTGCSCKRQYLLWRDRGNFHKAAVFPLAKTRNFLFQDFKYCKFLHLKEILFHDYFLTFKGTNNNGPTILMEGNFFNLYRITDLSAIFIILWLFIPPNRGQGFFLVSLLLLVTFAGFGDKFLSTL